MAGPRVLRIGMDPADLPRVHRDLRAGRQRGGRTATGHPVLLQRLTRVDAPGGTACPRGSRAQSCSYESASRSPASAAARRGSAPGLARAPRGSSDHRAESRGPRALDQPSPPLNRLIGRPALTPTGVGAEHWVRCPGGKHRSIRRDHWPQVQFHRPQLSKMSSRIHTLMQAPFDVNGAITSVASAPNPRRKRRTASVADPR